MSCDVYILGNPDCGRVYVYPNQKHPSGGGRKPYGRTVSRRRADPDRRLLREDELAVILLMEALTTSG